MRPSSLYQNSPRFICRGYSLNFKAFSTNLNINGESKRSTVSSSAIRELLQKNSNCKIIPKVAIHTQSLCLDKADILLRPCDGLASNEESSSESSLEREASNLFVLVRKPFSERALEINRLFDNGELKAAKRYFKELLSSFDYDNDPFERINYLLSRFLTYPVPLRDPIRVQNFKEACSENFFKEDIRDERLWSAVVHDTIVYATKERHFAMLKTFGIEYRNSIWAIVTTMHKTAGERFITNILAQIEKEDKIAAFNATICFLNGCPAPVVYADFSLRLVGSMEKENLVPSADAYAAAINLCLMHISIGGLRNEEFMDACLIAYRESLKKGYNIKQRSVFLLCKTLVIFAKENGRFLDDLIEVVLGLTRFHYKLSRELSEDILHLLSFSCASEEKSRLVHDTASLQSLWKNLRENKSRDRDRVFYVLLNCFSVVIEGKPNCHAMVKDFFMAYLSECKPTNSLPFAHYINSLSNVGTALRIYQPVILMQGNGIPTDTATLNALLIYFSANENYKGVVRCFRLLNDTLKNPDGKRPYRLIEANAKTFAIAFEALSKEGKFEEARRVGEKFFEFAFKEQYSHGEFRHVVNGLVQIYNGFGTLTYDIDLFKWANKQISHLICLLNQETFCGSYSLAAQYIVRASAFHVKALKTPSAASDEDCVFLERFYRLVLDSAVQVDDSTYSLIFGAMAHTAYLVPQKSCTILSHLDRIHKYMLEFRPKIQPDLFSSLFILFKNTNQPLRLAKTYEDFLELCKSKAFQNRHQTTLTFNTYLMAHSIPPKSIFTFLSDIVFFGGSPDEHTLIHLFKSLDRQRVWLEELDTSLKDIERYFDLWESKLRESDVPKIKVTFKLVGVVAQVFQKVGGPKEMTRAINHLIEVSTKKAIFEPLPPNMYPMLVKLSLHPFENNTGEEAVYWLEKHAEMLVDGSRNPHFGLSLSAFYKAHPSVSEKLKAIELKKRLSVFLNSKGTADK